MLKKILIGSFAIFVGIILLVAIFGESNDERNTRLLKEKKIEDSIEKIVLIKKKEKDSIHSYRLKNDRSYRDSLALVEKLEIEKREADERAALEKDKFENPQNYINVTKSGWK